MELSKNQCNEKSHTYCLSFIVITKKTPSIIYVTTIDPTLKDQSDMAMAGPLFRITLCSRGQSSAL